MLPKFNIETTKFINPTKKFYRVYVYVKLLIECKFSFIIIWFDIKTFLRYLIMLFIYLYLIKEQYFIEYHKSIIRHCELQLDFIQKKLV